MMNEDQIADVWTLFKDHIDKKNISEVAEKFVDFLADYGVSDITFQDCLGTDLDLDEAINYYLEIEEVDDEDNNNEWDE